MPPPRRELRGTIGATGITPRPVVVRSVENEIQRNVEDAVKSQLGLSGNLPADLREIVATAAQTAAATGVELAVARAAEEASRDIGRKNVTSRFDDKIKVAAESLTHISQSSEVDEVLQRRSELLAKKRASLVAAGFSNDEAMQIVLADIAARSH
jgi:hypothetical protein